MPPSGPLSKADYRPGTVNGMKALVGERWWVPLSDAYEPVDVGYQWMHLFGMGTSRPHPFTFQSYLPDDAVCLTIEVPLILTRDVYQNRCTLP